jgi:hypothetical protein
MFRYWIYDLFKNYSFTRTVLCIHSEFGFIQITAAELKLLTLLELLHVCYF